MCLLVYKMKFLESHNFGNNPMADESKVCINTFDTDMFWSLRCIKGLFYIGPFIKKLLSSGGWDTHAIARGKYGGLVLSCLPKMEWDRGVHSCLFTRTFTPIKRVEPSWLSLSKLFYHISLWEFNVRISGEYTHSSHRNKPYGLKLHFIGLKCWFQEKGAAVVPVRMSRSNLDID